MSFEFWIPDNPHAVHGAWSPYIVPEECPTCGAELAIFPDSMPGPFNAMGGCNHTMQWDDLRKISTPKAAVLLHCFGCNAPNPQAEPNRPGGKYMCFECRAWDLQRSRTSYFAWMIDPVRTQIAIDGRVGLAQLFPHTPDGDALSG